MVFVTTGLAEHRTGARDHRFAGDRDGRLTVAVVTKPFAFEGKRRQNSERGLQELIDSVDTTVVIPTKNCWRSPRTRVFESFRVADDILRQAVQGISTSSPFRASSIATLPT